MDTIKIKKGSPQFIRGFSNSESLESWLSFNTEVKGLAFVGRSNVGKSSLINSLFGQKTARISKTPGRTQEINVFTFTLEGLPEDTETEINQKFYLFDLPGYGHANVSKAIKKNWNELMNSFFVNLSDNTLLVNVQDARHPNQKTDQQFYSYINTGEVEVYIAFNKLDKLKTQKERSALNKLKPLLFKEFKAAKQIYFVSAEKKTNLETFSMSLVNFLLKN